MAVLLLGASECAHGGGPDEFGYTLTNPLGETLTVGRDSLKNVNRITDPLGRISIWFYNVRGIVSNATRGMPGSDGDLEARYTYDDLGRLVTLRDPNLRDWTFAWSPMGLAIDEGGMQFRRYYVWSPGGLLICMIDLPGPAVRYPHFDRGGSTLALPDAAGVVTDSYAYDPFGRLLASRGSSTQPFRFGGRFGLRHEPAGELVHMRARYFDPETARFLSREPIWPELRVVPALNPYHYAYQNPLTFTDPTGEGVDSSEVLVMRATQRVQVGVLRPAVDAERSGLARSIFETGSPRAQSGGRGTSASDLINDSFYGSVATYSSDATAVPSADGLVELFNDAASGFSLTEESDQSIFETYYQAFVGLNRGASRSSDTPQLVVTENAARLIGLFGVAEFGPLDPQRRNPVRDHPDGSLRSEIGFISFIFSGEPGVPRPLFANPPRDDRF